MHTLTQHIITLTTQIMKKILFYVIAILGLILSSCEPMNLTSNKVATGVASDITSCSALLHGEIKVDASTYKNLGVGIMIAETEDEIKNHTGELLGGKLLNAKKLEGKEFKLVARDLLSNKEYFYCAVVFMNNSEYEYGALKTFTTTEVPTSGKTLFSISETKKVVFSPGNLQHQPSSKKWRFAEEQWQCIGGDNANLSSKYKGWVDLFGWSTNANFGVSTSAKNEDYAGDFIDWGINQIGDDAPNTWRTLEYHEWGYLVFDRPNASSLRAAAQVNGVNGMILLPDEWICPDGVDFKSGFHTEYGEEYFAEYQSFSLDEWRLMENEGALFLPAGALRIGTEIDSENYRGLYWTATPVIVNGKNYNIASYFYFSSNTTNVATGSFCEYGMSVRLVKDL